MFQKTREPGIDAFLGLAVPYLISPNDHYAPVIIRSVKSVPLFQKAKNGERIETRRERERERGAKAASHSHFSFFAFVMPTFRSEKCYQVAQLGLDFI